MGSLAAVLLAGCLAMAPSIATARRAVATHASVGRAVAAHASARRAAVAARSLQVKDSAKLHLVSADGNTLVEEGRASGTLPGTVRVSLTLRAHTATSTFSLRASGGAISGNGQGSLKVGKGGYDSFGGRLSVRHGSGRFRHASGSGGLYGAIYRVTDAMNVQVAGTLRY